MNDVGVLPSRHKLTVDEFYRMAEAGILVEGDRVELIDGEMFDMAPIGQVHAAVVNGLTEALVLACAGRAIVSTQNPVRLGSTSEPQPDLAVLRRRPDFYATGTAAGPGDVLLLIEVADTSLRFDRAVKLPLYAAAGIAEYWIVDLQRRVVDAYRAPVGNAYGMTATYRANQEIALAAAPEIIVRLALMFG